MTAGMETDVRERSVGKVEVLSRSDEERLRAVLSTLEMTCWYHRGMNCKQAKRKLRTAEPGTFLIRDSSDDQYLFSLSVKTVLGTTSVRIEYCDGQFRLDSEDRIKPEVPLFDCVVKLIQHYIDSEASSQRQANAPTMYWLEPSGRRDVRVKLSKPLKADVPSLQHLSRCSINQRTVESQVEHLPLPTKMKEYLLDYPYSK